MCGRALRSTIHLKDKHTKNAKKKIFNRSVWETPPQLNMFNNFPAQKMSFCVQVHTRVQYVKACDPDVLSWDGGIGRQLVTLYKL